MRKQFSIITISLVIALIITTFCYTEPTLTSMVSMRDDIKLATDIYLPDGEGPWPVIFFRTPYGKGGAERRTIQINQRGYALVSQDIRGRFDSEGVDYPVFGHGGWGEHQDGYDTVEWIAAQKWCNGKVGTVGAISSSNSPRFEPNPNTGKPSGMDDETKVATNTIYLDAEHPSHILLPFVSEPYILEP